MSLIIRCVFCNSGRMDLDYGNLRYMVHKWGFLCLDYFYNILISWNHKLGCTAGFVVFAFIGFYFEFFILLLLYYICVHPGLPLVYYPTGLLLLSYYTLHVPYLISQFIAGIESRFHNCISHQLLSLPAPVYLCSWHDFLYMLFNLDLSIHVCLTMHVTWLLPHHPLGSSDSPGSVCPNLGAWSL